jgi:glutaredoxin
MRRRTTAALLAAFGLALAACGSDVGTDAGTPAESAAAAPAAPPAAPEPPASVADAGDVPPTVAARTYYGFVDENGSFRFVDSLDDVPEDRREKARSIAIAGGPPAPEAPAAAPPVNRVPTAPVAAAAQPDSAPPAARAPDGEAVADGPVVVYTTSWCPWCRKTLAWLDEQGVAYVNKDIERNLAWRRELIEKTGQAAIPVVEIEGEIIRGFDPERMKELL